MKQTLIYLTKEQHEALRNRAHESRTSISDLVRTAVEIYLTREHAPMPRLPKKEALKEAKAIIKQAEEQSPEILSVKLQGKCEAPYINCRFPGELYEVEFQGEDGLAKKKVYLCPGHAKKARETSESVKKL